MFLSTYGKNLNALTSKLLEVKASLMSSSVQDELCGRQEKNMRKINSYRFKLACCVPSIDIA